MLDHHLFLNEAETTLNTLRQRGIDIATLDALNQMLDKRRQTIAQTENLRQALNQASSDLGEKVRAGQTEAVESARTQLKEIKQKIKAGDDILTELENTLQSVLLSLPNLPHPSVPVGQSEADNRLEQTVGTPPRFDFEPKAHWDLVESLGIVSFEQAAKISGARFAVYRGAGARLERALAQFMLDHARRNGFFEIAPPLLVREQSMEGSGQYPKFRGEAFETQNGEYALIPTSEVPLVNLHRDEILESLQVPVRYTALTACFRREAGSAGKDTRGLIRNHQFSKVEMVSITTPEKSEAELEFIRTCAEKILQDLGLAYQVKTLCTGDLGFAATKTYDLEVWLPGQSAYREISSCSNCGDFQARRARIRYRPENATGNKKNKPQLAHTLNGSGLAVGRTLVAVIENYQQADGSIRIPPALVPYFGAEWIRNAND